MTQCVYIQLYSVELYDTAIYRPWSYRRKSPVRFASQYERTAQTSITNLTFWHAPDCSISHQLISIILRRGFCSLLVYFILGFVQQVRGVGGVMGMRGGRLNLSRLSQRVFDWLKDGCQIVTEILYWLHHEQRVLQTYLAILAASRALVVGWLVKSYL